MHEDTRGEHSQYAVPLATASAARVLSPVVTYVTEEVRRQGHDLATLDGIERVGWMLEAWAHALRVCDLRKPLVGDAINLATLVEREKNYHGIRTVGVRVGMRRCPDAERVEPMLVELFSNMAAFQPVEFYKEFELIHPFVDGNGRTGKILLNWMNGTLLAPIFPPADLFGHPILNP